MEKKIIYQVKVDGAAKSAAEMNAAEQAAEGMNAALKAQTKTTAANEEALEKMNAELDRLENELKQAKAGTDRFIAAQKQLAAAQRSATAGGSTFASVTSRAARIQSEAAAASNQAAQSFGVLGQAMNLAKAAGAAFIGLQVVDALRQQAQAGLQLAGQYENTKIAFETFLGSAARGQALLSELNKFSIETPFTSAEVISAGKQLVAFGFSANEVGKTLKTLGNISAGTGTNFNELVEIFGRIRVQGRLYQEDVNQFTGRGIPVYEELAKVLKTSEGNVRKFVEAGKVGFPEIQKAIAGLTAEGGKFSGLIEKQSKTLPGLLSTISGAWDDLLRKFAESSMLEPAKQAIISLTGLIAQMDNAIDPDAPKIAAAIESVKKQLSLDGLSEMTGDELAAHTKKIEAAYEAQKKAAAEAEKRAKQSDSEYNKYAGERLREIQADKQAAADLVEGFAKRQAEMDRMAQSAKSETEKAFIEKRKKEISEEQNALMRSRANDNAARRKEEEGLIESLSLRNKGAVSELKENFKAELSLDKKLAEAKLATLEQANIDAQKKAADDLKIQKEKAEAEKADWLKLQLFRRETELQSLKDHAELERKSELLTVASLDAIISKLKEVSKTQQELDLLGAKNQAQKALVYEKTQSKLIADISEAENKFEEAQKKIAEKLKESGQELANSATKAGIDTSKLFPDLKGGLLGKNFVSETESEAQKLADRMEKIFGKDGMLATFEKIAPQIAGILGDVFSEQERRLDDMVSRQQKRVDDAQAIADQGNAAALSEERKRLAVLTAEREKAAKRSQVLAQIETRIQIGLAVAKAAAAAAGTTLGIGALVAGAATAVALPAIINNLPLFEDGGVVGGKPHSAGGTALIAERGEFITNKRSAASFMPALKNINTGQADPALVNAAATGNISNHFALQMQPVVQRLESVERAINGQKQSTFLIDEDGWAVRSSVLAHKAGRVKKIIG